MCQITSTPQKLPATDGETKAESKNTACSEQNSANLSNKDASEIVKSPRERLKSALKVSCRNVRSGLRWVWKDLKKPHLVWLKVLFLLQSASLVSLYPYLNIHMRSLGLGIEDAAVVNGEIQVLFFP